MDMTRFDYQEAAQARMNEVHALFNVYRARLLAARGECVHIARRELIELQGRKLVVENRLTDLVNANEETWASRKCNFEEAVERLENATDTAIRRVG